MVPVVFFELWPTKGFQYLLPVAPAFAILAARTLARWMPFKNINSIGRRLFQFAVNTLVPALIALVLLISSWQGITPSSSTSFTAGTGGIPGSREAGEWVFENTPKGAVIVTIGPSMSNILRFYGQRKAYALSVSPNPLFRNPAYEPVINPDLQIRDGDIQYLVWDSFSADRSVFFSNMLMKLGREFNGQVVHTEFVSVKLADGTSVEKPVIVIYEVHQ